MAHRFGTWFQMAFLARDALLAPITVSAGQIVSGIDYVVNFLEVLKGSGLTLLTFGDSALVRTVVLHS